jgi:4'-phosphopantetheinyl transferase
MWSTPPPVLALRNNQVHLWKIDFSTHCRHEEDFVSLLSEDEKIRANKFKFNKDRLTYIIAKTILRKLIGSYTKLDPKEIQFNYNKQSKPFIDSEIDLKFNLSHSGQKIIIGFTLNYDIGVDVEYNKRQIEIAEISKRFFSVKESTILMQLSKEDQQAAFYNCWTRKEAFIKAKGGGLSIPLDQFEVTLALGDRPELKIIKWDQNDVVNWNLKAFNCDSDYTGAVIVNHNQPIYKYYDWNRSLNL